MAGTVQYFRTSSLSLVNFHGGSFGWFRRKSGSMTVRITWTMIPMSPLGIGCAHPWHASGQFWHEIHGLPAAGSAAGGTCARQPPTTSAMAKRAAETLRMPWGQGQQAMGEGTVTWRVP